MTALPSSIEAALKEAGFSATEILVLKRLMEEDGLSLRQIAAKTGKSTGVLDQATKKLLRKGIITKEGINGSPKFVLHSLAAISKWMESDMKDKRETLTRRYQNFESFLSSVELDKKRPEMQYFDGEDGIQQAYLALLGKSKEMLHYLPITTTIEEDPLRDFRVQYFRERRRRGIFVRVIAHNTPLGRRFQSRDAFEYRETLLVDEADHPFNFEKIIVGDIVACINHTDKKACLMKFADLAESERKTFEHMWAKEKNKAHAGSDAVKTIVTAEHLPVSTRTLSAVRDFFLSKKSLLTMGAFVLVAAGITIGLYMRTSAMNLERMKDKVQAIATTASFQFDSRDLDQLQIEADWKKPEWTKVVLQLKEIKASNSDIMYAYIVRKEKNDPTKGEFVADADSLNPFANDDNDPTNDIDINQDGKIDAQSGDLLAWPGQKYPTMPPETLIGFKEPTTNKNFYEDQWGKVITGYAPIKDREGNSVAVLAIDMNSSMLNTFNAESFTPILCFLALFLLFVLIRLTAFNRSLFRELYGLLKIRKIRIVSLFAIFIVLLISVLGYQYLRQSAIQSVGLRLQSIATTAAQDFSDLDLNSLRFAKDMKTDVYQKAYKMLNDIRNRNALTYAYIYRPSKQKGLFEFVADADSNYYIPGYTDANFDGKLDGADENVFPGFVSDDSNGSEGLNKSFKTGLPSYDLGTGQWGSAISGYAPIYNKNGKMIGILGVDYDITNLKIFD